MKIKIDKIWGICRPHWGAVILSGRIRTQCYQDARASEEPITTCSTDGSIGEGLASQDLIAGTRASSSSVDLLQSTYAVFWVKGLSK
jgi:hypothetical protein